MRLVIIFLGCYFSHLLSEAQRYYTYVPLTGYNHDVIAEGRNGKAVDYTSIEMDAINPSNFVLCSRHFAKYADLPSEYGLPDNNNIAFGNKSFYLNGYGKATAGADLLKNNVLFLLKNQKGRLKLLMPQNYEALSILGLATEGPALFNIVLNFSDSTNLEFANASFPDWFNGPNPFYKGFGRIKRINRMPAVYEGAPDNPMMYTVDLKIPSDKTLISVDFHNISTGENAQSNRLFIFAISALEPVIAPVVAPAQHQVQTPRQVFKLQGNIVDEKTGTPLQAKLQFSKVSVAETLSGVKDGYSIDLPDSGTYRVNVSAPGYFTVISDVSVSLANANMDYKLKPIETGARVNLKNVLFEQGTSVLIDGSKEELDMVVDLMKNNPQIKIELAGHTDIRGSRQANLKLSQERAEVVRKYIVSKGIEGQRVTGKGYGGSQPLSRGSSEADQRLNRRVEFVILEQ